MDENGRTAVANIIVLKSPAAVISFWISRPKLGMERFSSEKDDKVYVKKKRKKKAVTTRRKLEQLQVPTTRKKDIP